jgi:16S rRNA (uracil1498-N3)-methyltransferase
MKVKPAGAVATTPAAIEDRDAARARLHLDAPLAPGADITLGPEQAAYLRAVLRLQPGAAVDLFNARDGEFRAGIASFGKGSATLAIQSRLRAPAAEPGPWLLFALVKRTRVDFIVEKATELGVERLVPVITRRTQSARTNLERLTIIATEAAEQCERLTVPTIAEPVALESALSNLPPDRRLVAAVEAGPVQPIASLTLSGPIAVLIGPEGGFEPAELRLLAERPGTALVGLGPRILRADTAALAALATLQSLFGDGAHAPRHGRLGAEA